MSQHPDTKGHDLQDVLTHTRLLLGKAQDDAKAWEATAKLKAEEVKALRAELAHLQESYHLLNSAVARVMTRTNGGDKR